MGTHQTKRDQSGLMRFRETNVEQWGLMRLRETKGDS